MYSMQAITVVYAVAIVSSSEEVEELEQDEELNDVVLEAEGEMDDVNISSGELELSSHSPTRVGRSIVQD